MINTNFINSRKKRHLRIRKKISGTASIPRLNVYRSNTKMFVQIIDDIASTTLVSASTLELGKDAKNNIENAKKLGTLLAKKAQEKKINEVLFDRGGFAFHGKVKAFADACKEEGLKF